MSALMPMMDFASFQDYSQVTKQFPRVWTVTVLLEDLTKATFTVENCSSAYRAQEETFLYLKYRVYKK